VGVGALVDLGVERGDDQRVGREEAREDRVVAAAAHVEQVGVETGGVTGEAGAEVVEGGSIDGLGPESSGQDPLSSRRAHPCEMLDWRLSLDTSKHVVPHGGK
jgi:hypothetical protein